MPSFTLDVAPADLRWPIIRGDDPRLNLAFFDEYYGVDHADNVPSDLTGFTYASKVAQSRGGDVVATPTVTVDDPTTGEIVVSLTDTQTDLLTNSTYVWDFIENPGTTTETTLITGRMTVAGRASP